MQKSGRHIKADGRERLPLSDSQNFITEKRLIQRIVNLSNISKDDTVIEIGTGKGHLTDALCRKGGSVRSVELDRRLYERAGERLGKYDNLELICGDFLKYPLPPKGSYKVFANIPYFITARIVKKLTEAKNPPTDIWLVMEKGAAKRFMGLPRESAASLCLKVNWEMKIAYYFRREDFHPAPSVDSVLLYFSRKAIPDLSGGERAAFAEFAAHCMKYGICGKRGLLTKRQAETALKRAGMAPLPRDGVILYVQWLCLFRYWLRLKH
ncbi:MAG: rRNA adenine N(6)-methyltransferase family protein [Butyrivibrio sp.]|nr:rRNA adenine N(6)-methyltransferase family protein [Butyrivibrio sp.]